MFFSLGGWGADHMLTFTLAVFLLIITPGPGVLSLAGVGTVFGWQPGLRYLAGLFIGTNLVCLAVVSGLAALVIADHTVRTMLAVGSAGYLSYLALRVAFTGSNIAFIRKAAPGFLAGVLLQLINPKAYAVNTALFSSFAFYPESFVVETSLKLVISNLVWVPLHMLWLYAGVKVKKLNLAEAVQRQINFVMAGCLIAVAGMSLWSMLQTG